MKVPKAIAKYIDVVNHPGYYIRMEIERVKSSAQEKVTEIVSKLIILVAIGLVALFVLVFLSITVGLLLNDALDSSYLGFLIVTGFYILILGVLFLVKNHFEQKLLRMAKNSVVVPVKHPRQMEQSKNGHPSPVQPPAPLQEVKSNGKHQHH
uniref:Phage holin family protein n=1 Tax=Roseihalotalea indica TaxID=2867963 RepID=A0AA49JKB5_9BACT|nr:phage holin family protein [Tunicatimonas sp. TK19036]